MNFSYKCCNVHFVPLKDEKEQIVLFKMNKKEQIVHSEMNKLIRLKLKKKMPLQLKDSIYRSQKVFPFFSSFGF